jgi:anaerobic selenocysteine-containing dehydrogenase
MRPDLFTVVHEQFFTDTTDYADIVLPATTFFEQKELVQSYGHYYLQMSDQAIEPLGECRSNVETFRALAQHMGLQDDCFEDSVDDMIDTALESENPWLNDIDRDRLELEGHVRLGFPSSDAFLPFAKGNFPTASGKAELYSEAVKLQGLDPVVEFTPPTESRHTERAKASTFTNLPVIQAMEETGLLEINSSDARSRGISDGDKVRVFNKRGEILLKARVDGAVQSGVVAARLDWAKLNDQEKNINVLTSEKLTDLGNSATFYSVLVEVELFRPSL